MNATDNQAPAPDELEELLPWHAAGTLSRREAERVEEALERDPALAQRYALVREEMAETIHLNETLGAPSSRALDNLFAKIDAEPKRRPRRLGLGARVSQFFASLTPRTLAVSTSAAAVVIMLQAGLIANIVLNEQQPAEFKTASAPPTVVTRGLNAPADYALIRFRSRASAAGITQFLRRNELTIVDGPSGSGVYRVRISEHMLPRAERDRLIASLKSDEVVEFIASAQ